MNSLVWLRALVLSAAAVALTGCDKSVPISNIAQHIDSLDEGSKIREIERLIKENLGQHPELVKALLEIQPENLRRHAIVIFIRRLSERNAQAGLDAAGRLPAGNLRTNAYNDVFQVMPSSEWLESLNKVKREGLPEELDAAISGVRKGVDRISAEDAISVAKAFADSYSDVAESAAAHAGRQASSEPNKNFLEVAGSLPIEEAKAYLWGVVFGQLNVAPASAADFWKTIPPELTLGGQVHMEIAESWATRDPRAALDWAGKLSGSASISSQAAGVAMISWLRRDFVAASTWAKEHSPQNQRTVAIASVINFLLSKNDSVGAGEWLPLIGDPAARERMAARISDGVSSNR